MRFMEMGDVKWRIRDSSTEYEETSGICWFQSIGATQGVGLQGDTIQTIGNIAVIETTESIRDPDATLIHRHVSFLQRPKRWPVGGFKPNRPFGMPLFGKWRRARGLNLRIRAVMHEFHRDGPSPSSELEFIRVPGVEFEQSLLSVEDAENFLVISERAWFVCRSLLMFYLKQHVDELDVITAQPGISRMTTRAIQILPRETVDNFARDTPTFSLRVETFLAQAISRVLTSDLDPQLLYAASFGYADSFKQTSSEGSLTSVTESIERLLTLFEESRGLKRGVLAHAEQRRLAKALKLAVETVRLPPARQAAVKLAVSAPTNLTLEARIRRMAKSQKRHWSEEELDSLSGLETMIKIRNDLVHGRKPSNHEQVYIELSRSRIIFEKLYLCLLGCGKNSISSSPFFEFRNLAKNP